MLTQLIVTSAATGAWGPGAARQIALAKPPQFHIMRRVALFGLVEDGDGPLGIDVLAENGDILHAFTITRGGFEYLRRSLRFRVDRNVTTHSTGETR